MPLVVTDKEASKHNSHGSGANPNTSRHKNLRRSRTLNEEKRPTSERPKVPLRHASQTLEDLVRCAICLEQLRRPTMLPCQHTFCLACLRIYAEKKSTTISCPTCRLQVALPLEGINAFPTNILLQAFIESLSTDSSTQVESTSTEATSKGIDVCFRCSCRSQSNVTCQHCNQLFCKSCHLLHTTQLKKNWSDVIDDLFAEKQRLCLIKQESKARYKKIRDNVRASVAIQMQQLSEKQEQLLVKLKLWREEEAAKFTEIQELCDQILAQTPTIGSRDEEPVPNADVLKQSEAILQTARLCGTTRLIFDSEELSLTCQSTEMEETDGCVATSISTASAAVLHASVCSSVSNESSTHSRTRNRRVLFTDPSEPAHLASYSAPPTDCKKPPEYQSTADKQSLYYRSLPGHPRQRITSSLLQRPAGVAVSPWTGEIYVAATDSHRVYVVDKSGKIIKSLGSPYRSDLRGGSNGSTVSHGTSTTTTPSANCGTFLCPFGIAFSTVAEEIYVTDKWLNCIQVFNKEGAYERQIGAEGSSAGHFRSPEGIAVDRNGNIYVCDTCNDRVQVLDRNGIYFRELGVVSSMTLPGGKLYQKKEFSEPTGVAVSPDGSRIAVCDFGNCRIKVFGTNGELVVVFGFRGTQRGQFQHPECLAIDDQGFILVGDNGNGRIQIFRPNGNFVRTLGTKGAGPGQFNWISGLTLSKDMDIIVTDFKNHCIQFF
ncbi:RING finger protein nhl-1-like [Daphnia magna]|uniref:RING finger protein nhl-1-like n=1 Tax=Daphnia magna TaxID=35525 RepID=UPI001402F32A|nr:RING finger protein nhl-1-like [Daphnia magna]